MEELAHAAYEARHGSFGDESLARYSKSLQVASRLLVARSSRRYFAGRAANSALDACSGGGRISDSGNPAYRPTSLRGPVVAATVSGLAHERDGDRVGVALRDVGWKSFCCNNFHQSSRRVICERMDCRPLDMEPRISLESWPNARIRGGIDVVGGGASPTVYWKRIRGHSFSLQRNNSPGDARPNDRRANAHWLRRPRDDPHRSSLRVAFMCRDSWDCRSHAEKMGIPIRSYRHLSSF
jgi:hypothetical protein